MKGLLIDNFDSFTENLHTIFKNENCEMMVVRNHKLDSIIKDDYDFIVISPGPGLPQHTNDLIPFINNGENLPIFGVCLGLQTIVELYGGRLIQRKKPLHGIQTNIYHANHPLFRGIGKSFKAARYHSWEMDLNFSNEAIEVIAFDDENSPMAIAIRNKLIYAVQFHPESILTPQGDLIIRNFIEQIKIKAHENIIEKTA